jgi:2-hydroxychromene-2-carboxylate isomerase
MSHLAGARDFRESRAHPLFLYDLTSPYAYLAAERLDTLFDMVEWRPVYALAILRAAGRSPWPLTHERESRMREVELRARARGLPPVRWPDGWPHRPLLALRAAVIATQSGFGALFARNVFRLQFVAGRPIDQEPTIGEAAVASGLEPRSLLHDAASLRARDLLQAYTDEAIRRGVTGVPSLLLGDRIFWGDDRLEAAAAWVRE